MNREIKFRIWQDNKIKYPVASHIANDGDVKEFYFNNSNWDESKNGVLMQYTGLADKNNKEIYEGDIIAFRGEIYQVKYRSGCFMLDNIKNGKFGKYGSDIWHTHVWHTLYEWNFQLEIIGNIFENPELLK